MPDITQSSKNPAGMGQKLPQAEAPTFQPSRWAPGAHLQTLAGMYWPAGLPRDPRFPTTVTSVQLPDGDRIALHLQNHPEWKPGAPVALLLHGLAGSHASGYMARVAHKLAAQGFRAYRMDMRGIGAAAHAGAMPAHAGRSEDALAALAEIQRQCGESPVTMIGFSMGGNIALLAALDSSDATNHLQQVIAVSPPADLHECCRCLQLGVRKNYDRYLARRLIRLWESNHGRIPGKRPGSIMEFDTRVTAPASGFRDVFEYYSTCSSGPRLREIEVPTIILAAKDDPMVPYHVIADFPHSKQIQLVTTASGGHLGFVGSRRNGGVRRWLDQQIVEWADCL